MDTAKKNRVGQLRAAGTVALLLLFLSPQTVVAKAQAQEATVQAAPSDSLKLTLNDAVGLALKQNLDIQIANIETATRQQNSAIARSELLPHAGFEADDSITRYNLKALIGVQFPEVPHSIGPYQALHVGPTFSGPIFDMTLVRQYQASGHRLQASRADEQSVREETVLLAVSEYMAHLRALASITAAESRVKLATQLARQADDLRTDGVATRIDVSRAQVRLREEQQRLVDAQRDADVSMYALKRALNLPDSQRVQFTDQQDFFSTPPLEITDPLATALGQRPELRSLTESVKVAELAHKAAVSQSLPKLAFTGRWNEQGQTFNAMTPGYEYRVGVSLPIFTGGKLRAERRSTALTEQKTVRQLSQARNHITEQVRDGQVELQAALHQVELGKQEVQLANEEVTLSQGRFQSGVTDNIEVIAAQDSLARANDAQIGALFRYNIARAQLARAVGAVEQNYTRP